MDSTPVQNGHQQRSPGVARADSDPMLGMVRHGAGPSSQVSTRAGLQALPHQPQLSYWNPHAQLGYRPTYMSQLPMPLQGRNGGMPMAMPTATPTPTPMFRNAVPSRGMWTNTTGASHQSYWAHAAPASHAAQSSTRTSQPPLLNEAPRPQLHSSNQSGHRPQQGSASSGGQPASSQSQNSLATAESTSKRTTGSPPPATNVASASEAASAGAGPSPAAPATKRNGSAAKHTGAPGVDLPSPEKLLHHFFGGDVNHVDVFGNTILHVAAAARSARHLREFLAAGASPFAKNKDGKTPLMVFHESSDPSWWARQERASLDDGTKILTNAIRRGPPPTNTRSNRERSTPDALPEKRSGLQRRTRGVKAKRSSSSKAVRPRTIVRISTEIDRDDSSKAALKRWGKAPKKQNSRTKRKRASPRPGHEGKGKRVAKAAGTATQRTR